MFEIVPTKLPHYILPAYPAVAFMGALWAMRAARRSRAWLASALALSSRRCSSCSAWRRSRWCRILAAADISATASTCWLIAGACIAGAALGIAAVVLVLQRRTIAAAVCAVAAAVIFYPLIVWGVAPQVPDQIWMSPHLAARVAKDKQPNDPPVVLAGYVEPSLIFLLGTNTQIENGGNARRTSRPCRAGSR